MLSLFVPLWLQCCYSSRPLASHLAQFPDTAWRLPQKCWRSGATPPLAVTKVAKKFAVAKDTLKAAETAAQSTAAMDALASGQLSLVEAAAITEFEDILATTTPPSRPPVEMQGRLSRHAWLL